MTSGRLLRGRLEEFLEYLPRDSNAGGRKEEQDPMDNRDHHSDIDSARVASRSEFGVELSSRAALPALPFDRGGCEHQGERPEIGAHPGPVFRLELARAATQLECSLWDVALACFVGLSYRHAQQSLVSVRVWERTSESGKGHAVATTPQMRLVSCEIGENTTFSDIIAAVALRPVVPAGIGAVGNGSVVFGITSARLGTANPRGDQSEGVTLILLDTGNELALRLEFDGQAYRPGRMREFLAQYQMFAEQAARSPLSNLLDYSLVTDSGRAVLPDPRLEIKKPRYALVSESFLACAERRPNDIAVRQAERSWSYSEVARGSAALAARLCLSGIGSGDVVAVTGPRSYAVVIAMLGVFRSGGILLTLDPQHPIERQKVMMQQADAKCLVCIGQPNELVANGVRVVRLDALSGAVLGVDLDEGPAVQPPRLQADSPAYVFFTSGSTGIPKAVLGTHEGVGHFLEWQRRRFDVRPDDRASQITALSFDVVLRDVFLALTSGATLCIPAEANVLDPSAILTWMESERITILHIVPSLARAWLNHVPTGVTLSHLRMVFFAGEPLTDILVNRFREAFGNNATIVNLYGPTETTLAKCYQRVAEPEPGVQPVGRPIPETQVLILNRRRQLCGVDETGEIAIRTPFRTLGYLNAPSASERAFIRNPFRDDPDDLLYLTGDGGRVRTDGLLEISGRIDNQVKIRGMRVEPGEIEGTIGRHPGIREVAVVAFDNAKTGKFLAAYLVFNRASSPLAQSKRTDQVREFLKATLPDHMVPVALVVLDSLPLNVNGKVNRTALPPPDRSAFSAVHVDSSPNDGCLNQREEALVAIWRGALGQPRVGVNDSFGALGGDSLSAIEALVGMKRLGIPDDVARGIFRGLTIRQIAGQELPEGSADSRVSFTETSVFVRALSIVFVVAGHFDVLAVPESTDALFIVSGLSLARFQLKYIERSGSLKSMFGLMYRIALPTLLYTLLVQLVFSKIRIESLLFFDNFIDPMFNGGFAAWFIEVLLQVIAIMCVMFSLSSVRQFAIKYPYGFGLVFLVLSWLLSVITPFVWDTSGLYNRAPHMFLWLMAVGWCIAYSDTVKKAILAGALFLSFDAVSFLLNQHFFLGRYVQLFSLAAGILMFFSNRVPLPRVFIIVVNCLAGASMFIYLTHFQFRSLANKLLPASPPILALFVALVGGVVVWRSWEFLSMVARAWINKWAPLGWGVAVHDTRGDST